MEKLLEHNEGLPSRFPYQFIFEDYTDAELQKIMEFNINKNFKSDPFQISGGINGKNIRILVRRIGRGRGHVGFGNARAIQNELEKVMERQARRIAEERQNGAIPDDYFISKEDLLGPDPTTALDKSESWKELQGMIGLTSVKKCIADMMEVVKVNVEREKAEKALLALTLNRLFLG